jgi:hypothetical protein
MYYTVIIFSPSKISGKFLPIQAKFAKSSDIFFLIWGNFARIVEKSPKIFYLRGFAHFSQKKELLWNI